MSKLFADGILTNWHKRNTNAVKDIHVEVLASSGRNPHDYGQLSISTDDRKRLLVTMTPAEFLHLRDQVNFCAQRFDSATDAAIAAAVQAEREACAKIADKHDAPCPPRDLGEMEAHAIAAAIRAHDNGNGGK